MTSSASKMNSAFQRGWSPLGSRFSVIVIAGLLAGPTLLLSVGPTGSLSAQTPAQGDPQRGASAYRATCGGCHSIERNRVGPRHKGVVGRQVATEKDYNYSAALKDEDFTWNADRLNQWLTNPRAMVPGTKMAVRVPDPKRRADIIAYLETQ